MASSDQPFRRYSDPLLIPIGEEPSEFVVPPTFFSDLEKKFGKMSSFRMYNPNLCAVRLRGVSATDENPNPEFVPVSIDPPTGWGLGPFGTEIAGTQYPKFMSAVYDPVPGVDKPASFRPLEVYYGIGI